MPVTTVCPACSANIKTPDNLIGQTRNCPRCKKPVLLGNGKHDDDEASVDDIIGEIEPPVASPVVAVQPAVKRAEPPMADKIPWYYRHVDSMTTLLVIVILFGYAITLLVAIRMFSQAEMEAQVQAAVIVAAASVSVCVSFLPIALILIVADIGRSLRQINAKTGNRDAY